MIDFGDKDPQPNRTYYYSFGYIAKIWKQEEDKEKGKPLKIIHLEEGIGDNCTKLEQALNQQDSSYNLGNLFYNHSENGKVYLSLKSLLSEKKDPNKKELTQRIKKGNNIPFYTKHLECLQQHEYLHLFIGGTFNRASKYLSKSLPFFSGE